MLRFLAAALLVAAVSAQAGEETTGVQFNTAFTTQLPPFTAIDVGYRGCMPLSVTVQSGQAYSFTLDNASVRVTALSAAAVYSYQLGRCC